jgi:hypothetical protein
MFGGITIVCGIFGTLAGGFILDKIDSTLSNAFKVRENLTVCLDLFSFLHVFENKTQLLPKVCFQIA